jgi:post-segregation antitoxin (ccd killing protein)
MKQKLTITVDGELVPMAKRYARSRGVSLSSLIETELRDLL